MHEKTKRKYARLVLEAGVNFQAGQKLVINGEAYHWPFFVMVAEEAYKMGASYVSVEASHPGLTKARVDHAREETLKELPSWTDTKNKRMVEEGWARLSFFGSTDPDMVAGLDGKRFGVIQKVMRESGKPVSDACGAGDIAWCGSALPTPQWAAKIYNEEPSAELEERLWEAIVAILRLDADDPSAVWKAHGREMKQRCAWLESLELAEVRFDGPGTKLSVKCLPNAKWVGGGVLDEHGDGFIPNLPTEECFTTPDYRGTEGRVQVVRPVQVLGKSVEGAWFEFSEGKVINYGADKHEDALERYFEMCPQAAFLGELALVDASSPIFQSGLVFHCILYDENASSHIALGSGYPMAVDGGLEMTKDELMEFGSNVSLLHTDFMIGSPEVEVTGVTVAGEKVPLIRDGKFCIS